MGECSLCCIVVRRVTQTLAVVSATQEPGLSCLRGTQSDCHHPRPALDGIRIYIEDWECARLPAIPFSYCYWSLLARIPSWRSVLEVSHGASSGRNLEKEIGDGRYKSNARRGVGKEKSGHSEVSLGSGKSGVPVCHLYARAMFGFH